MRRTACVSVACILTLLAFVLPAAATPPLEAYAALPVVNGVRMSPDGNSLAMIGTYNGRSDIVVYRITDGLRTTIGLGDSQPRWVVWKTNTRLIVSIYMSTQRFGYRVRTGETRMIAVDIDGTHITDLAPAKAFEKEIPQVQDQVVSLLRDDPRHILVEIIIGRVEKNEANPAVFRVDVKDGTAEEVQPSRFPIIGG